MPEYEVVPIMHDLYKRSSANLRLQFSAFGRNVDIDLNPTDGLLAGENTPVWLASSDRNGEVNYKKLSSNVNFLYKLLNEVLIARYISAVIKNPSINYIFCFSNQIVGSVAKSFVAPRSLASFVVDSSTRNKPRFVSYPER